MSKFSMDRRTFMATTAAAMAATGPSFAANQLMEKIHFLIPGGEGGGWDGTARGTGEALLNSGMIGSAEFENMSGGGGGKAISYLIQNAADHHGTLMVNSTPIILRSLTGEIEQSFRDLTPVARVIGDYAAMVAPVGSDIVDMQTLIEAFRADPDGTAIGGGSVAGGMDHLVVALVLKAAWEDPLKATYIPYDAGGAGMDALLSGEIKALSTGFSEAVALAEAGKVNILGVTSLGRVPAYDAAPTMMEQALEVDFINWRGFFAAPGLPAEKLTVYQDALEQVLATPEWEEVRARNGWVNIHSEGDDFIAFLEAQERNLGNVMRELGFI